MSALTNCTYYLQNKKIWWVTIWFLFKLVDALLKCWKFPPKNAITKIRLTIQSTSPSSCDTLQLQYGATSVLSNVSWIIQKQITDDLFFWSVGTLPSATFWTYTTILCGLSLVGLYYTNRTSSLQSVWTPTCCHNVQFSSLRFNNCLNTVSALLPTFKP